MQNQHLSFRYRRRRTPQQQREFRQAQSRRARKRWNAAIEERSAEPVRRTRVVEIPVRDTHRPRTTIRLEADENPRGWSRWKVTQNGHPISARRLGRHAVGELIARWLE